MLRAALLAFAALAALIVVLTSSDDAERAGNRELALKHFVRRNMRVMKESLLPQRFENEISFAEVRKQTLDQRRQVRAQQTTVNCTVGSFFYDNDLGGTNASGGEIFMCDDFTTNASYLLSDDAVSKRAMEGLGHGDEVRLNLRTLTPDGRAGPTHGDTPHQVLSARLRRRQAAFEVSAKGGRISAQQATQLADATRFFTGTRAIRLLSIVISANGFTVDYAGTTQAEREAWAAQQRRIMSEEYGFSTFGKIIFDETNSRVLTANLGTVAQSSGCSNFGFQLCNLGSTQLNVASMSDIDGVIYYLPEGATPECGSGGSGTLGICSVGQLRTPNPNSAHPPYLNINRNSQWWHARCFVRYQNNNRPARANIGSHEFGHFMGMGHAGGNGQTRLASGDFAEYGDASAVMGNDGSAINSFTAPVRSFLGTLDAAEVTPHGALTSGRVPAAWRVLPAH
jgi:hypothetical protein